MNIIEIILASLDRAKLQAGIVKALISFWEEEEKKCPTILEYMCDFLKPLNILDLLTVKIIYLTGLIELREIQTL